MKIIKIFGKEILSFGEKKSFNSDLKRFLASDDEYTTESETNKSNVFQTYVWIYSCVQAISTNIARCELKFYNDANEEIDGTINTKLWESPIGLTKSQLFEGLMTYKCLYGEAFIQFDTGMGKTPLAIYLRDPTKMKQVLNESGDVIAWTFTSGNKAITIPNENILHFKYFNPNDSIRGLSPIGPAWASISEDLDAKRFNRSVLRTGSAVGGTIEVESEMGPEAYERLRKAFEQRHQGTKNAGKVAVLEGGAKYKEIKLTNQEMSYIEQRKLSREEILAVYKVPPVEVGLTDGINYANASVQVKQFWTKKLIPELNAIEDVINKNYLSKFEPGIHCNFDVSMIPELQEDINTKVASAVSLFNMGFTGNEVNEKLGLGFEDKPWRDNWWISPMLTPAGSDAQPGEEPQPVDATKSIKDFISVLDGRGEKDEKHATFKALSWKRWDSELRPLEKKYASKLSRIFYEWRKQVLNSYGTKGMTKGLLDVKKANRELIEASRPFMSQSVLIGGDSSLDGISDLVFNVNDPKVVKYLKDKEKKIVNITETIERQISEVLSSGSEAGKTRAEIADDIKKVFTKAGNRAETIAQTELVSASNYGRELGMEQAGFVEKEWVNAQDERVRDSHRIDGVRVGINEKFPNGLSRPGDENGPPEEVINCRCTIVPVLEK